MSCHHAVGLRELDLGTPGRRRPVLPVAVAGDMPAQLVEARRRPFAVLTIELAREPAYASPVELDAGIGAVRTCELLPVAGSVCDHVRIAEAGVQGDLLGADLVALQWYPVEDEQRPIGRPAADHGPGDAYSKEAAGSHVECGPPEHRVTYVESEGKVDPGPGDPGSVLGYADVAVAVFRHQAVEHMSRSLEPGLAMFAYEPVVCCPVGTAAKLLGFLASDVVADEGLAQGRSEGHERPLAEAVVHTELREKSRAFGVR